MKRIAAFVMFSMFSVIAINCQDIDSEETEADEEVIEETAESEQAIKIGDYYDPPRCGPRNCVAWCVTCEYDICRSSGGTMQECNWEKEACKQECYANTCEAGAPECQCTDTHDPNCL